MKKFLLAAFVCLLSLNLSIGDAEAARLGGGRSIGMQRQAVTPRPAAPAQQAAPAPARPAPAGAPAPAAPTRSWLGPIAGLAAGLGIAALFSHLGLGAGLANVMTMVLLAFAAMFVFRLLFRRNEAPQQAQAMQYAGPTGAAAPASAHDLPPTPLPMSAGAMENPRFPADFDSDAFLRVAKLNFVRLQAANDAKNIEDIREFVSPELFAEIKLQMDERGNAPQRTDIVTLNGEVLEVVSENGQYIASVHFSGMIRESDNAAASPFEEIWNLGKPVDGSRGWTIVGIQQLA